MCSVWIEQRIEEEKGAEKSLREIGRMIALEVEKHFEVEVKPRTIEKRASRQSAGEKMQLALIELLSI